MLPWDNQYFNRQDWNVPSELDQFSQNILNADLRSDHESKLLYTMIHDEYSKHGGIQEKYWLNLYEPLRTIQIDKISEDDTHPGIQSQHIFFDFLKLRLINRNKML